MTTWNHTGHNFHRVCVPGPLLERGSLWFGFLKATCCKRPSLYILGGHVWEFRLYCYCCKIPPSNLWSLEIKRELNISKKPIFFKNKNIRVVKLGHIQTFSWRFVKEWFQNWAPNDMLEGNLLAVEKCSKFKFKNDWKITLSIFSVLWILFWDHYRRIP